MVTVLSSLTKGGTAEEVDIFRERSITVSEISTYQKVKAVVCDVLRFESEEEKARVIPTASFHEDLGLDSLEKVELIMALEAEFEMEISDEEVEKIQTVQDAVNYIEEHPIRPSGQTLPI